MACRTRLGSFHVTMDKQGATQYAQVTYPVRYGRYAEIETEEHVFQYSLNGEIKYIQGRGGNWPDRDGWLKRTIADDWVYYASDGGYGRVFSLMGEHYLPCFSYPTNSIFPRRTGRERMLSEALSALAQLQAEVRRLEPGRIQPHLKAFLRSVVDSDASALAERGRHLHSLLGGHVSVLPPDTRHVDYNAIPMVVADGCLFDCSFCRVKSGKSFRIRSDGGIEHQIEGLRTLLAADLVNYNALFLGQHDALNAGEEILEFAARKAFERLELDRSLISGRHLFLFGSVDSMVRAGDCLFAMLDRLPAYTWINIGLESFDQGTLDMLGKPIQADAVRQAFVRMQDVNRRYSNVEVSANVVLGCHLPQRHEESLIEHARQGLDQYYGKGALYLSPMDGPERGKQIRSRFRAIKNATRLPT